MKKYQSDLKDKIFFTDKRSDKFDELAKDNEGNSLLFGNMYQIKSDTYNFYYIPLKYQLYAYQSINDLKGDVQCLIIKDNESYIAGQCIGYSQNIQYNTKLDILSKEAHEMIDPITLIKGFEILELEYEINLKERECLKK